MMYRVVMLPRAEADFAALYDYIAERSPAGAAAWTNAFSRTLKSLETNPELHGLAPEDEDHDAEIRQLLFRTRRGNTYRALYSIRGADVFVLHVRRPGQDLMAPDDLNLP